MTTPTRRPLRDPALTMDTAMNLTRERDKLVAEIRIEAASCSRPGQMDRLLGISNKLAAIPMPTAPDGLKLLGYANPLRIKHTCADKPGGAHLGQVAIYAGESVDPMVIQERESPTHMGEPDFRPACYSCGCRSDRERNWQGRSICSKCQPEPSR